VRLTTLPPSCAIVMKSGNLNFLELSGPLQACNGTALPLPFTGLICLSAIPASILVLYMKLLEENIGHTVQHIKISLKLTVPNVFQTVRFVCRCCVPNVIQCGGNFLTIEIRKCADITFFFLDLVHCPILNEVCCFGSRLCLHLQEKKANSLLAALDRSCI